MGNGPSGFAIELEGQLTDDDLPTRMPPKNVSFRDDQVTQDWSEDSCDENSDDDSTDYQNSRKDTADSTALLESGACSNGSMISLLAGGEEAKIIRGRRSEKLRRISRNLLDAARENTVFSHFEYCELHKEVNHNDETKHDDEVEAGIPTALIATLEVLLTMQNTDVEIRKTCTDLELIYRCSNECRSDSFDNIGHKVVPMLIKITKMALGGQIKHGTELILKRAVKILGYFALLENGRTAMMKQSGFLYTFVKVLQADIKIVSAPIKIDSIWMIANLAFADSLREMIYNYPHLVHSLVKNM